MTPQKEAREPLGSDICYCGDFRSEHKPKCFCGCKGFRFAWKAKAEDLATWNKYHANRCFAGLPGCDCYGTFQRLKAVPRG